MSRLEHASEVCELAADLGVGAVRTRWRPSCATVEPASTAGWPKLVA